ncbi:MAG: peptide chain release factor N(5)-glutamine methyltransferase [Proteobacteria bacterium]|nr:peptide chain release factor N(5)-glutamine methyltransferase [Pseudomonadota bacterium]
MQLLRWTTDFFKQHGLLTARLDAEVLLGHVLCMPRIDLYLAFDQPVSEDDRARYRELVRARAKQRVPVAYLTGQREFWSLPFSVAPDVLIPRPETESLVRAALEIAPRRIAEVGVGSGCVSAVLARELPDARLVAGDVSESALELARSNLEALELAERVELYRSDLLSELPGEFDLVVANPPYVPSAQIDTLEPEVRQEPRLALDGGPDGLSVVRRLIEEAPPRLARPGALALELGEGQAEEASRLARESGAERVETRPDLRGVERVLVAHY